MKFPMNYAVLILSVCISVPVSAAIPKTNSSDKMVSRNLLAQDIEAALTALQLPVDNRTRALQSQTNSFASLKKIIEKEDLPLNVRWRAMTSLGRTFPKRSQKYLLGMALHKSWFHRNSAMLALRATSPKLAVGVAEKLLNDPALVVRTAAVKTLLELNSVRSRPLLWKAMSSKQNFHKGQGLWVRSHIMKALAKFSVKADDLKFAAYLNDVDPKVQIWAINGLEKVTGTQQKFVGQTIGERRKHWVAWADKYQLKTTL